MASILVEGPNGSGKSTLASRLGILFNMGVGHQDRGTPKNTILARAQRDMVCDRGWLSGIVYPLAEHESNPDYKFCKPLQFSLNEGINILRYQPMILLTKVHKVDDRDRGHPNQKQVLAWATRFYKVYAELLKTVKGPQAKTGWISYIYLSSLSGYIMFNFGGFGAWAYDVKHMRMFKREGIGETLGLTNRDRERLSSWLLSKGV